MELSKLKEKIKSLEKEKQENKENKSITDIIDIQLKALYKSLNISEKSKGILKKSRLEKEKRKLVENKKRVKEIGDLEGYLEIEKKIKKINNEMKDINGRINFLTEIELKRLKNQLKKNEKNGLKYLLIVSLAYEGGLRVSELINLRISDIDIEKNKMLCRRLKGSKTNTILLTLKTVDLLKKYLKKYRPVDHIFLNSRGVIFTPVSLNDMFKRYCKKASITREKARFHSLKHSRAVHLAESGLMIQEINQMLGHKSLSSTMIYYSYTKVQDENIYSKLSGY